MSQLTFTLACVLSAVLCLLNGAAAAEDSPVLSTDGVELSRGPRLNTDAHNCELESVCNYVGRAYLELVAGEWQNALADCDRALAADRGRAWAYFYRGIAKHKLGRSREGIADISKAIEINPNQSAYYSQRGAMRASLYQYFDAVADYSRAIEMNASDAAAYHNRGLAYDYQREYAQAIADLSRAVEIDPKYGPSYSSRGLVYLHMGHHGQAATDFLQALTLNPGDAYAHNHFGEVLRASGDLPGAVKAYERAIELDQRHPTAYYNAGLTYYLMDQPYYSVRAYLKGFIHDRNALDALRSLTIADILSGRF